MTAWRMRAAAIAVALLTSVGCNGSSGPTTGSTPSATVTTSTSSAPTSPKITLPHGSDTPAALQHDWVDVHNNQVQLTFNAQHYIVHLMGQSVYARTSFRGHDMWATVQSGGSCPGIGHYRWSLDGSQLTFQKVSDHCLNRTDIFDRTYTRL